jgi:hypothetical protein
MVKIEIVKDKIITYVVNIPFNSIESSKERKIIIFFNFKG